MSNFFGLREIIQFVVENTEELHPDKPSEDRFNSIMKLIYGEPELLNNPGTTRSEFEENLDERGFFIRVAEERINAAHEGLNITVTEAVRRNIKLVKNYNNKKSAIKYWAEKYNEVDEETEISGHSYEHAKFLETYRQKREKADEIMVKLLSKGQSKRNAALNDIFSVLQKHGWSVK